MSRKKITIFTIISFVLILSTQVILSLQRNNGQFIYPIDDTYIHLAIARNFAEFGVWGIDKFSFSSTSSSLLYGTILSGLIFTFGDEHLVPFVVNFVFALGLLITFNQLAKKVEAENFVYGFCAVLLLIFMPLPSMALSGMEHVLHALLSIATTWVASTVIINKEKSLLPLLSLTLLIATIRYEGLFLVGIVVFILALYKRPIAAVAVLITGLLPVIIFGIISISNGSHFLPNTILIKSQAGSGSVWSFLINTADNFFYHISRLYMTVPILIAGVITYKMRKDQNTISFQFSLMTLLLLLSHGAFARVGRFERYEAYLMAQSIVCILIGFQSLKETIYFLTKKKWVAVLITLLLLAPGVKRTFKNFNRSVQAGHNIHDQQIQMAQFVNTLEGPTVIMANDIGALAYLNSDINLIDMVGLGSVEVLNMKQRSRTKEDLKHGFKKIAIDHSADMAIIYDHWFNGEIPETWKKLETWTIQNNMICGHETVSFYSINQTKTEFLKNKISHYKLPLDVIRKTYD